MAAVVLVSSALAAAAAVASAVIYKNGEKKSMRMMRVVDMETRTESSGYFDDMEQEREYSDVRTEIDGPHLGDYLPGGIDGRGSGRDASAPDEDWDKPSPRKTYGCHPTMWGDPLSSSEIPYGASEQTYDEQWGPKYTDPTSEMYDLTPTHARDWLNETNPKERARPTMAEFDAEFGASPDDESAFSSAYGEISGRSADVKLLARNRYGGVTTTKPAERPTFPVPANRGGRSTGKPPVEADVTYGARKDRLVRDVPGNMRSKGSKPSEFPEVQLDKAYRRLVRDDEPVLYAGGPGGRMAEINIEGGHYASRERVNDLSGVGGGPGGHLADINIEGGHYASRERVNEISGNAGGPGSRLVLFGDADSYRSRVVPEDITEYSSVAGRKGGYYDGKHGAWSNVRKVDGTRIGFLIGGGSGGGSLLGADGDRAYSGNKAIDTMVDLETIIDPRVTQAILATRSPEAVNDLLSISHY